MVSALLKHLLEIVSERIGNDFKSPGTTQAAVLDIFRALTGFGILVFFTNLSLIEFQVRYLTSFCLFSFIDGFKWFWMGSLHKNNQLMLEFLMASFLFLYICHYTLMTFLMILSVILLTMLMILLFTISALGHLICGNN